MRKKGHGVNPLHSEPFHIMYGPGAGVSQIVDRETREPVQPIEPILILRGIDEAAVRAAYVYAEALTASNPRKAAEVRRQADRMSAYLAAARRGAVPGK